MNVPFISVIIGEGGSGGAVALATANKIIMLEHSVYSVISPEGCASILWKNTEKMREAAEALKLTAQDLLKIKVIDIKWSWKKIDCHAWEPRQMSEY